MMNDESRRRIAKQDVVFAKAHRKGDERTSWPENRSVNEIQANSLPGVNTMPCRMRAIVFGARHRGLE